MCFAHDFSSGAIEFRCSCFWDTYFPAFDRASEAAVRTTDSIILRVGVFIDRWRFLLVSSGDDAPLLGDGVSDFFDRAQGILLGLIDWNVPSLHLHTVLAFQ